MRDTGQNERQGVKTGSERHRHSRRGCDANRFTQDGPPRGRLRPTATDPRGAAASRGRRRPRMPAHTQERKKATTRMTSNQGPQLRARAQPRPQPQPLPLPQSLSLVVSCPRTRCVVGAWATRKVRMLAGSRPSNTRRSHASRRSSLVWGPCISRTSIGLARALDRPLVDATELTLPSLDARESAVELDEVASQEGCVRSRSARGIRKPSRNGGAIGGGAIGEGNAGDSDDSGRIEDCECDGGGGGGGRVGGGGGSGEKRGSKGGRPVSHSMNVPRRA